MEFITIFFDYGVYSNNKVKLKKIMNTNGLRWNDSKMKLGLSNDVIIDAFKFFKVDNRIINDENLKGRSGSTGVWEMGENVIKIIMFDKKNEDEHLPVLLVYKGVEGEFFKQFIGECVKLGCEIGKIVETKEGMEQIFKKRINVELVQRLDSEAGTKEVLKEMFINRVNELKKMGYHFTESFIIGWKLCIDKYGFYTDKMLYREIENKNVKVEGDKGIIERKNKNVNYNLNNITGKEFTIIRRGATVNI